MTMPDGSPNVNTGGGDYAGRDIDKRHGTFNTYTEDTRYDVRALESPYLGLRSYSYAEHDRFAGRDRSLGEAASKLIEGSGHRSLLFVTGVSGSGKSSFVKAGLVPKLEEYYTETYAAQVRRADFRPAAAPIDQLTRAL